MPLDIAYYMQAFRQQYKEVNTHQIWLDYPDHHNLKQLDTNGNTKKQLTSIATFSDPTATPMLYRQENRF